MTVIWLDAFRKPLLCEHRFHPCGRCTLCGYTLPRRPVSR